MIQNLTIIDNLFDDPEPIRQFVESLDFSKPPVFDGVAYNGFCHITDKDAVAFIENTLSEAIGAKVVIRTAAAVASMKEMKTQQWIHADNTCAKYAAVIYMFKGALGFGTAMWIHKETGANTLTAMINATSPTDMEAFAKEVQKQGSTADAWMITDYCDSFYNRVVIYPTDRFHSRFPEQGFGDSPKNCRLTMSIFFDLEA